MEQNDETGPEFDLPLREEVPALTMEHKNFVIKKAIELYLERRLVYYVEVGDDSKEVYPFYKSPRDLAELEPMVTLQPDAKEAERALSSVRFASEKDDATDTGFEPLPLFPVVNEELQGELQEVEAELAIRSLGVATDEASTDEYDVNRHKEALAGLSFERIDRKRVIQRRAGLLKFILDQAPVTRAETTETTTRLGASDETRALAYEILGIVFEESKKTIEFIDSSVQNDMEVLDEVSSGEYAQKINENYISGLVRRIAMLKQAIIFYENEMSRYNEIAAKVNELAAEIEAIFAELVEN